MKEFHCFFSPTKRERITILMRIARREKNKNKSAEETTYISENKVFLRNLFFQFTKYKEPSKQE